MDIRELTYITAIAEEGSLSAAGKRLKVSQPTLSVFLSKLENSLGVDLFFREKKRLVPTPAGNIYLNAARKIISVHDQTYQSIHHLTHELTESINVGATPLRGSIMIAQIFPTFSKRFPDVKINIVESYMQELWNNRGNAGSVSLWRPTPTADTAISISSTFPSKSWFWRFPNSTSWPTWRALPGKS